MALLDDQATSPSVAVVEEGKQRSLFLSLSSPRRNRDELSLRRIEGKDFSIMHVFDFDFLEQIENINMRNMKNFDLIFFCHVLVRWNDQEPDDSS